ncbi:hypothetical protein J6590_013731 [Homalodisca vitripennis]|nr:hypothetical protein J6590_013731 [Homalodisca vitripennis]
MCRTLPVSCFRPAGVRIKCAALLPVSNFRPAGERLKCAKLYLCTVSGPQDNIQNTVLRQDGGKSQKCTKTGPAVG